MNDSFVTNLFTSNILFYQTLLASAHLETSLPSQKNICNKTDLFQQEGVKEVLKAFVDKETSPINFYQVLYQKQSLRMHSQQNSLLAESRSALVPKDSIRLKSQIDALLQNDYAVLKRHPMAPQQSLLTPSSNPLILHYVRNIYQEYSITDPLPERYRTNIPTPQSKASKIWNQSTEPQNKSSHKKITLFKKPLASNFQTPQRHNVLSSHEKANKSQVIINRTAPHRPISLSPSRDDRIGSETTIKKQIFAEPNAVKSSGNYFSYKPVVRTGEYKVVDQSSFSPIKEEEKEHKYISIRGESQQFQHFDEDVEPSNFKVPTMSPSQLIYSHLVTPSNNQLNPSAPSIQGIPEVQSRFVAPSPLPEIIAKPLPPEQIKQSFRYCIGCQNACLQANMKAHEQKCLQFQYVLQMPMKEIILYLKNKIDKFQFNIQQCSEQMLKVNPQEMDQHSRRLLEESRSIVRSGQFTKKYQEEYDSVVSMSDKWCNMAQQINKVNWFLKIRQRLKQSLLI